MIKKLLATLLVVMIAISLWHGVPLPAFIYEPALQSYTHNKPYDVSAQRVVLSLLPSPRARLLEMQLGFKSTPAATGSHQPLMMAPLLTLNWAWSQLVKGQLSPQRLTIKEPSGTLETDQDGQWKILQLINSSGAGHQNLVEHIDISDGQLQVRSESLQGQLYLDRLELNLSGQYPSKLGLRWLPTSNRDAAPAEKVNTLNISATAVVTRTDMTGRAPGSAMNKSGKGFSIESIEAEAKGPLGPYPWYGTLAVKLLDISITPAPYVSLEDIRGYVRRDDDPDSHQATLSAQRAQMSIPDGRLLIEQGQWSYTDHAAQSWSFDADADFARRKVSFTPNHLKGSESVPVEATQWSLGCNTEPSGWLKRWSWVAGWLQYEQRDGKPGSQQQGETSRVNCLCQ